MSETRINWLENQMESLTGKKNYYWIEQRNKDINAFTLFFGRPELHGLNLMQLSDFDSQQEKNLKFLVDALNEKLNSAPRLSPETIEVIRESLEIANDAVNSNFFYKSDISRAEFTKAQSEFNAVYGEIAKMKTDEMIPKLVNQTLFAHTFSNMCRWESVFNNMQQLPPEMRAWVCRVDEYKIAAGMYHGEQCVGFYFGPEMYPYFKEFALELDQLPEGFEKTIEEKIKLLTVALEG